MIHRRTMIAGLAAAGFFATATQAQQAKTETLEVSGAFARATPPTSKTGVVFLTIRSLGSADRLVGYTTPACNRPELHTHIDNNGIMQMRQVEAIDVPAGGVAELKPGGFHLMLIDLNGPLTEGETFPVTLEFETSGPVEIEVPILGVGAMAPAQ